MVWCHASLLYPESENQCVYIEAAKKMERSMVCFTSKSCWGFLPRRTHGPEAVLSLSEKTSRELLKSKKVWFATFRGNDIWFFEVAGIEKQYSRHGPYSPSDTYPTKTKRRRDGEDVKTPCFGKKCERYVSTFQVVSGLWRLSANGYGYEEIYTYFIFWYYGIGSPK